MYHSGRDSRAQTVETNSLRPIISFIGIIHWTKIHSRPVERVVLSCHQAPCCSFPSTQPRFNTKPVVDYRFPLHFYLLNALSLFCGLLRAIGFRHRGPLISNSVNIAVEGGRRQGFFLSFFLFFSFLYIGLRRHQILLLVYSSSRLRSHYTGTFPPSGANKNRIY